MDRLHVGRLRLPDRGARGDDPARGALRGLPGRARDPDGQACGRPCDRTAVRRLARALRAHAEPPRLLARAAAPELPLARSATPGTRSTASARSRDIFAGCDIDDSFPTRSNVEGINRASSCSQDVDDGFIFTNLVETDMLWGHRNDPENFHRCLQDFDRRLPGHPRGAPRPATCSSSPPTTAATHDAVDRPLARARAAARLRRRGERGRADPRGRRVRRRRGDRDAWLGGKQPRQRARGIPDRRAVSLGEARRDPRPPS